MLWMMINAIDNERLAVRQVLAEMCRGQLVRLQARWNDHWQALAEELEEKATGKSPPMAFVTIVRAGLADSAIVGSDRRGPAYPALPSPPVKQQVADAAAWTRAEDLEYVAQKPSDAAKTYAALAKNAANADVAARAILAQTRCLARAGLRDAAIDLLADTLAGQRFARATDAEGRLIAADAELRALELIGDPSDARSQKIVVRLANRLVDYSNAPLGSSQRRFLIKSLAGVAAFRRALEDAGWKPALREAEELAATVLESGTPPTGKSVLQPSGVPQLWQFASKGGHVVALFRTETIFGELQNLATKENLPTGVGIALLPPKTAVDPARFFYAMPGGDRLPDWQLGIKWNDDDLAGATARGKIIAYVLVGSIAVSAASLLALWVAMSFRRQIRLARLKNDLVAAVSHELKTPLASIRLLVDTLLADDEPDRRRVREYLELIAKENTRLGRVIDNFLAFSRMERNKHAFTPSEIAPADVIAAAADAAGERFSQAGCRLEVYAEPDLPPIMADADAMTTALVNLLDNAYKYTDSDKQISLRAHTDGSWVYFDVADNGIGLSRAACRRVFERFYQVDRELSRSRGGCGLGLSIVEFIAREHGGRASVRSQPERGSTFTIAIPCCRKPNMEGSMST
jgi:signal transduction histidine kinase